MRTSVNQKNVGHDLLSVHDSAYDSDPILFGHAGELAIVAIEITSGGDQVVIFKREGDRVVESREQFKPFIIVENSIIKDLPVPYVEKKLQGAGRLDTCIIFASWRDCIKASKWLAAQAGLSRNSADASYLFLNDPVHQHMIVSGRTLFHGLYFDDLRRMQVDIECLTSAGYEFCNAEREGDRIAAIAVGDQSGWMDVITGSDITEKEILKRFVQLVRDRDPDVIEGHNIFNFDLPYIVKRAEMHGVKLCLGRDGSIPSRRPSRFRVAERTISYDRFNIFGRHVVDTLFLVHAYDVTHRELDSFGLKDVAVHFGLARKGRTYIEGSMISSEFLKNPERIISYVRDDIAETRDLSALLSRSNFAQAQMLPYSYQNICVRGNATKIDALMIREYLREGYSIAVSEKPIEFEGGYADIFIEGVVEPVHHCDIRSLYPSLMLIGNLSPAADELGVFLKLLDLLRAIRILTKEKMQNSTSKREKVYLDASQSAFKILINSFYGYLGFAQGHFSDYSMAEKVTLEGRRLLKEMIKWLQEHGARPIEIDTDGIYFIPPVNISQANMEVFRRELAASLPLGIDIEFDGEYRAMYSYKMKNYALLADSGEMIIKGAALKSRGLEPFQREFLRELLRMKLERRVKEIPGLKDKFVSEITGRKWHISRFAKTENLQDSPATYLGKRGEGKRSKSAVYELALRSGREYRAGDQISYYVTGERKSVTVYENCKFVGDWNPEKRDENVSYYLAKLDALYDKFFDKPAQPELNL